MSLTTESRRLSSKTFLDEYWFPTISRPPRNGHQATTIEIRFTTLTVGDKTLLYFAYNARISPEQMTNAAPQAEFQFIAHLPEWGLEFPIANEVWGGSLPAVKPEPGSTVWGAVYEIPKSDLAALDAIEAGEQRSAQTVEAMDRNGKRHQVVIHLMDGTPTTNGNGLSQPSPEYLRLMVAGSRHWSLPFGWIAGLEEHLANGL